MEYDKKILLEFADRLYKRARSIVVFYSIVGAFVGLILGAWVGVVVKHPVMILVCFILGIVFGFVFGTNKAFQLKLQAQLTMCQVQIEENTHSK